MSPETGSNNAGNLVINIGDGYQLVPPISLPTNATNISIGTDGTITYVKAGATAKTNGGQPAETSKQHIKRQCVGNAKIHGGHCEHWACTQELHVGSRCNGACDDKRNK